MAMGVSLLPEWGKTDPYAMGAACVDECVRQLVAAGADPERLAILDNFCMGNPDAEEELGALVETVKGIAAVAEAYGAPFVSGKDSFSGGADLGMIWTASDRTLVIVGSGL
jgi:phosphoribosylformylglycinamidine synthase